MRLYRQRKAHVEQADTAQEQQSQRYGVLAKAAHFTRDFHHRIFRSLPIRASDRLPYPIVYPFPTNHKRPSTSVIRGVPQGHGDCSAGSARCSNNAATDFSSVEVSTGLSK